VKLRSPHHNGPQIQLLSNRPKRHRGPKGSTPSCGPVRIIVRDGEILDPARYRKIANPAPSAESPVTAAAASGLGGGLPFSVPPLAAAVNDARRVDQGSSDADPGAL
jgi:hypothetical protein